MTPRAKAIWLHALTALAAACTVALAWQSGGIDAPVLVWLMVLPIGPFYLYGRRQGYAWLLISLTLLTAVAYWAPQQSVPHGAVDMVVTLLHYVLVSSVLIWVPARYHRLHQREVEVVQQRTDALEEKRAELQATQEARNRFIASISHELRTPMNAILGFNHLLLQRVTQTQACDILQHTRSSAEHLLTVINDVLDHSQLDAGQLSVRAEDCRTELIVHKAFDMLAYRARMQGLDYQLHLDADVPVWIHTDPHRLTQVLVNLLGNAVKFTSAGFVRLEVKNQNDGMLFSVEDSGMGIAEENQGRIFQRFEQAEEAVQSRIGGHGLGLNISSQIVQLLGGQIGFSSETQKGSRFWFWLPLQHVAVPEIRQPVQPNEWVHSEQALRFLVVDDHPINRYLVRQILHNAWPRSLCREAQNGKEALELLAQHDFDLVFMDMVMPEMDGIEATAQLRAWPNAKSRTPVLGLTANVTAQDLSRFVAAGVQSVVLKPFDTPALLSQVETLLLQQHQVS